MDDWFMPSYANFVNGTGTMLYKNTVKCPAHHKQSLIKYIAHKQTYFTHETPIKLIPSSNCDILCTHPIIAQKLLC